MHTSLPSHSLDSPPTTQRELVTCQGPPVTPLLTPSHNKPITFIAACCSASRAEAKDKKAHIKTLNPQPTHPHKYTEVQRNTKLSTPLTQTVYTSHINRSHAKCKTLVRESSAVNTHHTSTSSLIPPSPTAAAPYLPPKHPTLAHGRETNATCFITPACTVTDTPLPPGQPARPLMLADTSQPENLRTKPSSRPRPKPIAPIQWRRGGEDECDRRTPSLGEERHTHLVHLSRLISAVDNRHSLGLSCPIFPEIAGINLTGDPPHSPLHKQDNIGE
jgi:hypothetical protein